KFGEVLHDIRRTLSIFDIPLDEFIVVVRARVCPSIACVYLKLGLSGADPFDEIDQAHSRPLGRAVCVCADMRHHRSGWASEPCVTSVSFIADEGIKKN